VGKPLPGVEVKIDSPDASGVGEVLARGKNLMLGYWEDEAATAAAVRDGWFHTGDLGRFDEDGNLFLVGRSKEVIIDSNGKNVYPDEIEDLYRDCPQIKELSVVGLPEGTAEQIAAAVVPDFEKDTAFSPAEVRAKIEEHFATISATLPFWKRVKTMVIWEGDLPKTAKRSVKRREVVAELLRQRQKAPAAGPNASEGDGKSVAWFLDLVATVAGRPRSSVAWKSRVAELGFDSLMYNELAEALERAGVATPENVDFSGAADVAGLHELATKGRLANGATSSRKGARGAGGDIEVPKAVATVGKKGFGFAQELLFKRVLKTEVEGQLHIPSHTNFLVAANHASHLDMGAIKIALGEAGRDLASLAAADYFFSNRWRRAYFGNFTNLVPMDRTGSIRKSIDAAQGVLRGGRNLIVFPEGTRSQTGEMSDFLPSLGYLALRAEVGILPAYISGSFEALPKGSAVPKSRDLRVRFGPFLSRRLIDELTRDLSQPEGSRLLATLTQRIVEGLRDGVPVAVSDAAVIRAAWNGERLGPLPRTAGPAIKVARPPRKGFPPAISTSAAVAKHHGTAADHAHRHHAPAHPHPHLHGTTTASKKDGPS
jgi:long-chain acyl-CoA synthetase